MSEIIITKNNFDTEVLQSDKPVLVDFWATWCGPCKMLSPIISEIADQYEGRIKVCKVNVDEEQELSVRFGITNIPTVLLFKNGQVVKMSVGFKPKAELEEMIG